METVGFIGVGMMGEGMAACLIRSGRPVAVVAHRSRAAVDRLLAAGATEAPDLAALAAQVDALVLCVSDAPAVDAVMDGLAPSLRTGQLIIDTSTSDPKVSRRLAATLATSAIAFADAPVTGGPAQAAEGALGTLLGADADTVARASAIVTAWSKVVCHVGAPGAGHTAKLLNNFVTQGTTLLLAEAYDRARRADVDWRVLFDVMQAGAARSGTLEKTVGPAIDGDFDGARFAIRNAAKDLRYYAALAEAMDGAPSTIAAALANRMTAYAQAGHGERYVSRLLDPEITLPAH